MLDNKLNAYGGFTPAALAPPKMRYHLIRYCVIIAKAQGRFGGTDTVPPVILPVLCISYFSKRNSTEPKI